MELRILSGLHRGATLDLHEEADALTIGVSTEADVLLADAGIAQVHCRLSRRSGQWHIEPVNGKVHDSAGKSLVGAAPAVRGSVFGLGKVQIGFYDETDPWHDADRAPSSGSVPMTPPRERPSAAAYKRSSMPVAAGALAVLLVPAMVWAVSAAWGKTDAPGVAAVPAALSREARPEGHDSSVSPAKLAEEFTRALADRELSDRLELQLGRDHWDIRGSLEPEEQQRLERLLVRFTATHPQLVPINVTLLAPSELLPFKLVEVVTGKGANVVVDTGERLYVGDTHEGYRLSVVEAGKIVFTGKRRVEVAL